MAAKSQAAKKTETAAGSGGIKIGATKCPISRAEFKAHAEPLPLSIGESKSLGMPREFSSRSLGWYFGEKVMVSVNGSPVKCQVTCSVVVVGSKEAK